MDAINTIRVAISLIENKDEYYEFFSLKPEWNDYPLSHLDKLPEQDETVIIMGNPLDFSKQIWKFRINKA